MHDEAPPVVLLMLQACCLTQMLDKLIYRVLYTCTSSVDQYAMSFMRKNAFDMVRNSSSTS